jgi:hypothetical protein
MRPLLIAKSYDTEHHGQVQHLDLLTRNTEQANSDILRFAFTIYMPVPHLPLPSTRCVKRILELLFQFKHFSC